MKKLFLILIFIFTCCTKQIPYKWMYDFIKKEEYRIVTVQTTYNFRHNKYILSRVDTNFKTYDINDRIIGENNRTFYIYDSLDRIQKELFCWRTCDYPLEELYKYNSKNQLIEILMNPPDTMYLKRLEYYLNGLLKKETIGSDTLKTTIIYTYNTDSTLKTKTKREYSSYPKKWIVFKDSYFYSKDKKLIKQEWQAKGSEVLQITKFTHNKRGLLIETIDTVFTSKKNKKSDTIDIYIYHGFINKKQYTYDSLDRIIEKIQYGPDYKTPGHKLEFKYEKIVR